MLIDVLTEVAGDTGYHPVQQRSALLSLANRAAKLMHKKLECNKMFREVTLVVMPDSVVALPSFVGEIRGMRMHTNELPFDLHSIGQPRYTSTTLAFRFKNWRDLGESPVCQSMTNIGKLTIESPILVPDGIKVVINAQTNIASRIEEEVDISGVFSKFTTNLFGPKVYKISCLQDRNFDITIKDDLNNTLAILPNTDYQTRYKLVDVSQIFWTLDTSEGESFIDICYKVPVTKLSRDTDSFYAGDDYDPAWYHMMMHLFFSPLENKQAEASQELAMSIVEMDSIKEGTESEIIKKVQYGRNKFYGLFRKYRYYPGSVTNVDNNIQS